MTEENPAPTAEEIAKHFTAMGHSVALINSIISPDESDEDVVSPITQDEKNDMVDRNVRHLQIMKERDFWTNEDFAEVDAAITAGQAYLA